jgi:hypothetical protein
MLDLAASILIRSLSALRGVPIVGNRANRILERLYIYSLREDEIDEEAAERNSRRVVEILAANGQPIRGYSEADYMFLGRFLSLVLLLENAIDEAISGTVPDCRGQMLGRKIDSLKGVLKRLRQEGVDTEHWDKLIAPLRELSSLRGKIAHNIKKKTIEPRELRQAKAYVKRRRPNMFDPVEESTIPQREKELAHLVSFVWCVMERLSFLQHELNG